MSQSIPASNTGAGDPAYDDRPLLEVKHRGILLLAVMTVSICQFLDSTIANVALPHMKVSLGASPDSITWALTSFITAGAVFMPMSGWLSDRIGSRNLFIGATLLFLVSSAACGAATSLPEMVVFRAAQGMSTAFMTPMTQTILFDVSAPRKQAQTMATFGMMAMVAPISGPFLGGFLVEYYNWRWVFYINLPLGIPALIALWWLLPSRPVEGRGFDKFGFLWIAFALGTLQLVLDRGQHKDWFESWEIIIEAIIALSAFWVFLVHSRSVKSPLFRRELFANRDFMLAVVMMLVLGMTNVALSAILPTMYQTIYHYPVMDSGLLMAPRGFGVVLTSQLTVWLMNRVDYRPLIMIGYLITAYSMWIMTTWSLDMDATLIVEASFVQGLGMGVIFGPMNLLAFSTIRPEFRPDGSALMALSRNLGGSLGISWMVTLLARNQQISHSDIASHVTPGTVPGFDWASALDRLPGIGSGALQAVDGEVTRQAAMISYVDNFYVVFWLVLVMAPLPFVLKKRSKFGVDTRQVATE